MTITPDTGLIEWLPDNIGDVTVTLQVEDQLLRFDEQSYILSINAGNTSPQITSTAITSATVGQNYNYLVSAEDADGDNLSYSLQIAPVGMSINQQSGLITWQPSNDGLFPVRVAVNDNNNGTDTQTFNINVALPANQAPVFTNNPITEATAFSTYSYQASATDPEGTNITYRLDTAPIGMQFNASNGQLTWQPTTTGRFDVVVTATDATGLSNNQTFTINTDYAADAPVPNLQDLQDLTLMLGESIAFNVNATGATEMARYYVLPTPLPAGAQFNSMTAEFTFSPTAPGVYTFPLGVNEMGFVDTQTINITVPEPDPAQTTRFSGRVMDANDLANGIQTPIVAATVRFLDTNLQPLQTTQTDSNGAFQFDDIPGTQQIFDVDASTAQNAPDGSQYGSFREKIDFFEHIDNIVERPFSLPRIATNSLTTINPNADTLVVNPDLNVQMLVPAGSARHQDGSLFTGQLSISEVPRGFAPVALPTDFNPDLLVTIQPVGLTFSEPARIDFPNNAGFIPNQQLSLMSLERNSGDFAATGLSQVSADGTQILSQSGGLRSTSWHFLAQVDDLSIEPNPEECELATGSTSCLSDGALGEIITLPGHQSLNQTRPFVLSYQSRDLNNNNLTINGLITLGGLPDNFTNQGLFQGFSTSLNVGGTIVAQNVFEVGTDSLSSNRLPIVVAASGANTQSNDGPLPANIGVLPPLPAGIYSATLTATTFFQNTSFSNNLTIQVPILGPSQQTFGNGWSLNNLYRSVEIDNAIMLQRPGRSAIIYASNAPQVTDQQVFTSPDADFSTLQRLANGNLLHTDKYGNRSTFNPQGQQIQHSDRNNNTTQYLYNGEQLTQITDPVGQITTLTYQAERLKQVIDPLGRVSRF